MTRKNKGRTPVTRKTNGITRVIKMIEKLMDYVQNMLCKDCDYLFKVNNDLARQSLAKQEIISEQNKELNELEDKLNQNENTLLLANSQLQECRREGLTAEESSTKKYWENKYHKTRVTYPGRPMPNNTTYSPAIDVRNFTVNPDNKELQDIAGTWKKLETQDQKLVKAQTWVKGAIKYTTDTKQYKKGEYWCYPWETLKNGRGDCEDGAILMYALYLAAGGQYWRARLTAGDVNDMNGEYQGGHCYLTYLPDAELEKPVEEQKWVLADWCYYPDTHQVSERIPYKEHPAYAGKVWFSWNKEYSYNDRSTRQSSINKWIKEE